MNIPIITVTNQPHRAQRLVDSATKNGWKITVLERDWFGFGTKVIELYKYLCNNPDITRFVFTDAHDVYALGSSKEFYDKIAMECAYERVIFSCEKACWPDPSLDRIYDKTDSDWKYLNSGLFYADSNMFISMFEENPIEYHNDDQLYYTHIWLSYLSNSKYSRIDYDKLCMELDHECRYFQSYSFIAPDDFSYNDRRPFNMKTKQMPVFFHGNGKTDMSPLDRYL